MEQIKRVDRIKRYRGSILTVYEDVMEFPDGSRASWDFIGHGGGAGVVAVRGDGRILMVRQYRPAIDAYSLEIPAGAKDDPDEDGCSAALRELSEETGYTAAREDVQFVFKIVTAVAFCNETTEVFLVKNLKKGDAHPDDEEFLDIEAYSAEELKGMIYGGQITDAKTVAALLAYFDLQKGQGR